jgi:hypothetical protein
MRQSGNQNLEGKMPDFTRRLEDALYKSAPSKVRAKLVLPIPALSAVDLRSLQ